MRIPDREVLFIGKDRCPEFDYQEPIPEELRILLCLLDGAERRHQLQAKLNDFRRTLTARQRQKIGKKG
jgi:hypothetical protein